MMFNVLLNVKHCEIHENHECHIFAQKTRVFACIEKQWKNTFFTKNTKKHKMCKMRLQWTNSALTGPKYVLFSMPPTPRFCLRKIGCFGVIHTHPQNPTRRRRCADAYVLHMFSCSIIEQSLLSSSWIALIT